MVEDIPTLVAALIILLAIEIIILISRRLRQTPITTSSSIAISSPQRVQTLASDLVLKLEQVQDDFCDLERRYHLHHVQEEETKVAHMIDSMYDTFVRPRSRLAICAPPVGHRGRGRRLSSLCNGYETNALDTSRMSGAFTSFCERLLANEELDSYKLALGTQDALHEHELKQFTWEWYQEYWKLVRQIERLSLAQQASSVQQDLQNDFEDSLCESLEAAQRRVEELEARLEGYQNSLVATHISDDDHETIASSSVTCVSFDGREISSPPRRGFARLQRMPMTPRKIRSARWVDHSKRQAFTRPKRLILGKHTGFSFNPLFYGPNASPLEQWKSRQRPSDDIKTTYGQAKNVRVQGTVQRWRM